MNLTEVLEGTGSETVRLSMATDDGETVRNGVSVRLRERDRPVTVDLLAYTD